MMAFRLLLNNDNKYLLMRPRLLEGWPDYTPMLFHRDDLKWRNYSWKDKITNMLNQNICYHFQPLQTNNRK